MTHDEIKKGLLQLGFETGWVISGDEITVWEHNTAIPTTEELTIAAKLYVEPTPSVAEKLASVGLSLEELKAALGGN